MHPGASAACPPSASRPPSPPSAPPCGAPTPLPPPKRRCGRLSHCGVVPPLSGPPSFPVGCTRPDCTFTDARSQNTEESLERMQCYAY
eukprot:2178696-Prymnesium_polylepis.2